MPKQRHLDLVTGEVDPDAPTTLGEALALAATLQLQLDELTRKYHGALAQIGNLRADRAKRAEDSDLWGVAIALFNEWRFATGHEKSKWTADRFWACEPYLREYGFHDCRCAIWGLAANCFEKQLTAGYVKRYDEFFRPFKNADAFEGYVNAGRAIFGAHLSIGEETDGD